jgi:hypothetical protein
MACSSVTALNELPASVFEPETGYVGKLISLGHLAEAHVTNKASLEQANNKLVTICVAANRCKDTASK